MPYEPIILPDTSHIIYTLTFYTQTSKSNNYYLKLSNVNMVKPSITYISALIKTKYQLHQDINDTTEEADRYQHTYQFLSRTQNSAIFLW